MLHPPPELAAGQTRLPLLSRLLKIGISILLSSRVRGLQRAHGRWSWCFLVLGQVEWRGSSVRTTAWHLFPLPTPLPNGIGNHHQEHVIRKDDLPQNNIEECYSSNGRRVKDTGTDRAAGGAWEAANFPPGILKALDIYLVQRLHTQATACSRM